MERKKVSVEKGAFTRSLTRLTKLIESEALYKFVEEQFERVRTCYHNLEIAHNAFLMVTDIDIETHADGLLYMTEPDQKYDEAITAFTEFQKRDQEQQAIDRAVFTNETEQREKAVLAQKQAAEDTQREAEVARQVLSEKAILVSCMDSFQRMFLNVKDSLTEISATDRRAEWKKVDLEFISVKEKYSKLISLDPALQENDADLTKKMEDMDDAYHGAQKEVLESLRDSPAPTSGGSRSSSSSSTVRKEPVRLPKFQGDPTSSPYLKFPVWKTCWDKVIASYDDEFRAVMLHDNVDDFAKSKYIGYEHDYEACMERLVKFFGDPVKIVSCVVEEVMSQTEICEGDYKSLLQYSVTLESNFNRLVAMGFEHEMCNTSSMTAIMKKFPRSIAERWHEHLSARPSTEKLKPFPILISWLTSRKETWESMSVMEVDSKEAFCHYTQGGGEFQKRCYGCGNEGHFQRDCKSSDKKDEKKKNRKPPTVKKFWCALHKDAKNRRCFSDSCQDLRRLDAQKRVQLLKENGDCSHCCGDHKTSECKKADRVCGGGKTDRGCSKSHKVHELFCVEAKCFAVARTMAIGGQAEGVMLLLMQVKTLKKPASVFWDLGSDSNFVRDDYAKECGFKGVKSNLCVTTLGGEEKNFIEVMIYTCFIVDVNGQTEKFEAYGMNTITDAVSKIDKQTIGRLFPHLSHKVVDSLMRGNTVEFLIGMYHPSWHPNRAEEAGGGGDLWVYRSRFGACIGGRHPEVTEGTRKSKNLFVKVHQSYHISTSLLQDESPHELEYCPHRVENYHPVIPLPEHPTHCEQRGSIQEMSAVVLQGTPSEAVPIDTSGGAASQESGSTGRSAALSPFAAPFQPTSSPSTSPSVATTGADSKCAVCLATKTSPVTDEDLFFRSQLVGTLVQPRCGGCKCSKCPIDGMEYSFKEQQELNLIQKNLVYVEEEKRWYTEYPWATDRSALPRNEKEAYQAMVALERRCQKNPELGDEFCKQIQGMLDRSAAVILTDEELREWEGDYHYLTLLGVKGRKGDLRVVFNAAQRRGGFPSFNDCLMKGPDNFMNKGVLPVLIGFRNGRVAAMADLRKFHNQVRVMPKDVHMQRFLWRDLKTDEPPKTHAVIVNNFGVKPANCIATSALHKSADVFAEVYPVESEEIKEQLYVDDELFADKSMPELKMKTQRIDEISEHAGMSNKGWTYSGDDTAAEYDIGKGSGLEDHSIEKVLGTSWVPKTDSFHFQVQLKLKTTNKTDVVISTLEQFDAVRDNLLLTRRVLLANVARIFDPVGFVTPVLLEAKLLLRESWCGEQIGWDDPLPLDQQQRWITFLASLLLLNDVHFQRSLWPEGEVIGLPTLVIFSDGAKFAFGAAAYIRWELAKGGYWSQLIMSKCRVAPKNIISIPRMELNGAVIGNRMKSFLMKTNLRFGKVYQIVDSSTVLGYVQKECGVFRPYEGVRVAEIQSSNTFTDGTLEGWAWVAGTENPSDWCTKTRTVRELSGNRFWAEGPSFLLQDESKWPLRVTYKKDLEGELKVPRSVKCFQVQVHHDDFLGRLVNRTSSWTRAVRMLAWILRFVDTHFVRRVGALTADEVARSRAMLIKFAQRQLIGQLEHAEKGKGRFAKLCPVVDEDGVWRVGSRMRVVPFTLDAKLPVLLPNDHRVTLLIMEKCHRHSHLLQDGTVARFRCEGF